MDDPRAPSPTTASPTPDPTRREDDLLRACRAGDATAWQRLVEKYERLVYAIPLRMGLDREEAADIFQLTFAALLHSLDAIRDESRLGGWLATVARRQSWAALRRRKAELNLEDLTDTGPQDAPSWAEYADALGMSDAHQLEAWELALWLNQGLAKLSRKCRDLLTALYLDVSEPSYADLSARLGIPLGSIGPTRARCLERLREALRE